MIVPTLSVGMHPLTLRVNHETRSVQRGIPTQSVGTIRITGKGFPAKAGPTGCIRCLIGTDQRQRLPGRSRSYWLHAIPEWDRL